MNKTVEEFFQDLKETNTFFSVVTTRKNDKKVDGQVVAKRGETIKSVYRFNVPATKEDANKRLAPGVRAQNDQANGVITAWDVNKDGFRRINLDGVTEVHAKGLVYEVEYVGHDWVMIPKP